MNIVPFAVAHIHDLLPVFGQWISNLSAKELQGMEDSHNCFAAKVDGKVIGVAGILDIWAGVGEAYTYFTPEMLTTHKWSMHRAVTSHFDMLVEKNHYHRVQCLVALNHASAHRWAQSLGFKFEGVMPMYTADKRTMTRYGKIWL